MINSLVIGEKIENNVFILNSLVALKEGYQLVLSDKTGEVLANVRTELITEEVKASVKGPVKVTAVVKPGRERKPELIVKAISKAEKSDYKSDDLFDGLSDDKISEYVGIINHLKGYVHHDGFRALLDAALDSVTIERLSQTPATIGYYGKYKGGALSGAALVSLMVTDTGSEYVKHFNALYQSNIDWSLLLTASLLNTYGVLDFLTPEEPFRKTSIGVERGYFSVLQSRIERVVLSNNVPLSDEELSRLLNVLESSVSSRTSIRAVSKEGILLRHCLALFAELDMLDYGVDSGKPEESDESGYFYSQALRRYITA